MGHEEYVGSKTHVRMLNTGLSRKIEDLVTAGKPLESIVEEGVVRSRSLARMPLEHDR